MADATARIDSTLLETHRNRVVRVIGKAQVVNPDGNTVVFDSNGTIKLLMPPNISFEEHQYYEVTGKVGDDLSVRVLDSVSLGSEISKYIATFMQD